MAKINLRDLYPHYKGDSVIDIPDEVLEEIEDCEREEETYKRYLRFYGVATTLDGENPHKIESKVLDKPQMPHELYEKKMKNMLLHQAISQLPDKQAKRIYAYYFLGMSNTEIAKAEGVYESAVRESIERGLRNLKKYLKSIF